MDEVISTFVAITGATPEVGRGFIQITNGDFERAVGLYFENPELASVVSAGVSGSASTSANPSSARARQSNSGRQDASGIIHISDDDDDVMMHDDDEIDIGDESERAAVQHAAAMAQEVEDAAMAKRLQEEIYSSGSGDPADQDGVRAPIARTTETLVAPDPSWADTPDDSSEQRLLELLRSRRHPPPRTGGPFGQRIWSDGDRSESPANNSDTSRHARRLEDLFRPPYDLMSRLSWDEARTLGKEDKKWILVNLQDMSDFNCQALNRDIWKDTAVRELVAENFIFLQYDKDYPDAEAYIAFYFPNRTHENPDNYPHVSIVDPRTGEQVKVWAGKPFPTATEFHAELAEFLDRFSLASNSKNPLATATPRKLAVVDVDRMTEEEMLEMAMQNSLAAAGGESSRTTSTPNNAPGQDAPAAKSQGQRSTDTDTDTDGKGKGKEPAVSSEKSAFSLISSGKPHTEPDNDPATTTRIQFRHPTGRVIRRFNLQDPIRRIYEWLKAEPLEGKNGVPFELKKMPQGQQDLIASLDQTIEECGLKQGTVMIEFIED
ncbi:hypothetical protein E4U23_007542 [Claviceps purpurea]|nr:hypothetical protein E4U10_007441 [Claviceps purpurea]KAG6240269.1 hypothetical protein E4U23_007542 [Claviceps purpurea]